MKNLIIILVAFLAFTSAKAQLFGYSVDGNTQDFTRCNGGAITIKCKTPYQGAPKIVWTLFLNGSAIVTEQHNKNFAINGTDDVTFSVSPAAGSYYVERKYKNLPGTTLTTTSINVTVNSSAIAGPAFIINQLLYATTVKDIYNVTASGPIKLDASLSCPNKPTFFISIQLSDIYLNRYNYEASGWFNSNSNQYGSISNFNLKQFAQNNWFTFHPGQYYRVKVAFGSPWQEITRLIKIN